MGRSPISPVRGRSTRPQGSALRAGFREQATRVFDNLTILLEAAGTSWEQVTKVGVFLADLNDFAEMNEVYQQYVTKPYPARTTAGCQLPNILIEVDCIAVVPE